MNLIMKESGSSTNLDKNNIWEPEKQNTYLDNPKITNKNLGGTGKAEESYYITPDEVEKIAKKLFAKDIKGLRSDLKNIQLEIELSNNNINTIEQRFSKQMMQIITIFIGFFTFISVEMQIFKNVTNWSLAIALSFVLLGFIMIFAVTINWLFKDEKEKDSRRQIVISILSLLFIAVGVWLIYNSKYRNDDYILKENLSDYYTKQEFNNKFDIENQKTQNILNCAKYSDAFWKYKECIK